MLPSMSLQGRAAPVLGAARIVPVLAVFDSYTGSLAGPILTAWSFLVGVFAGLLAAEIRLVHLDLSLCLVCPGQRTP